MGTPIITYCTNIHPACGMIGVRESLGSVSAMLRERLSSSRALPIGLRLSDSESREIEDAGAREKFDAFLTEQGLRCVCVNGFPFGAFHNRPVKDAVHRPDWRDPLRREYTIRLSRLLAGWLREGESGGVSTSPLSYKPWGITRSDRAGMTANIARAAASLLEIAGETGRIVHVDIEPEPDGEIETVAEFSAWFERELAPAASRAGVGADALRTHIRLCLDACHLAVMHEEPGDALDAAARVGVRVGRVQVSNAIRMRIPRDPQRRREITATLEPYAESVYLHQTVGSAGGRAIERWADLPDALGDIAGARADEWHVHYHVPIFWAGNDAFGTTQGHLRSTLAEVRARGACDLFEIETYTWSVLPAPLRVGIVDSIEREWRWLACDLGVDGTERSA